jgi:hypothetical protein
MIAPKPGNSSIVVVEQGWYGWSDPRCDDKTIDSIANRTVLSDHALVLGTRKIKYCRLAH